MKKTKKISLLLLAATLTFVFSVQPVKAFSESEYIIISGGTFYPDTAPISQDENVYTFFDNIQCRGIRVRDSNIIIDGDGYTLRSTSGYGEFEEFGIWLGEASYPASNITIKNISIRNFHTGIYIGANSRNNIIYRNTISDCLVGVDIQLNISSCDNKFYHNNFIDNETQVNLCYPIPCDCSNVWDDGYLSGGNYWSDHNIADRFNDPCQVRLGHDGICDADYHVDGDPANIDRYPLSFPYRRTVHNIETGLEYYTIQEAINAASPGDTIRVLGYPEADPNIDVGAYTDLDGGLTTNFPDLVIFAEVWLEGTPEEEPDCTHPGWCNGADFNQSGEVDNVDFGHFVLHWLSAWRPAFAYYENVDVNKRLQLIGIGAGFTIIDGVRQQSGEPSDVLKITENKVHIEGFTIRNAGSERSCVNLNGVQLNYIIGNTITNNTMDSNSMGIWLHNGADYNTIVDSDINNNTSTGIDISDSNNILISKSNIAGNADFGIQVSNSRNTRIVKNTLSSNNGGISIQGNCRENDIRGNDILSSLNNLDGIAVGSLDDAFTPSSITIASNKITSSYNGIKLCKVRNSAVSDNVLNGNAGHGLWLVEDPNIVIENNVIQSNNEHGIYVEDSNNFTIRENEIFDNGDDGIHLENSSVEDSNDVSIIATNKIYGNMSDGIDIENSICNIMRNIVTGNSERGIRLNSSGNTITYNSIMDNNSGIYVGGENNMIHHNVFVNGQGKDPNNAKAEDLPNLWDNDNEPNYIGNFWSDYLDKCPYAKQEGDDIKWNTPYPITVNGPHEPNDNRDRGPILLVSYKITKPHWLSMTMNERYNLELELTNNWAKFDPPGFDVDFAGLEQTDAQPGSWLDWVPGVEDFDWWPNPHWPLNITYDSDEIPEDSRTIPPDDPNNIKNFELDFKNKWDWIKPADWKDVVTALILTIPFPHGTELSIVSFAEACYRAALAVPSVKYIFEPHPDSSDFIILETDVTRNVPLHKPAFLFGSLGLQIASIKYAILAAPLLPWVPTFPAGVALTVKSVLCTVGSIIAYKVAEDPDPNYTQVFEPNSIVVPEVESLDDGDAKRLALAALELASLEHAYGQSCIRYDGAKTADHGEPDDLYGDPNDLYMALQLGAALKYSAMATRKAQEVEALSATVTSDPCVVERIAEFVDENYVTTFSLKPKQINILESVLGQIGLGPTEPNVAHIEYVIDQAKADPSVLQLYPYDIEDFDKHMHIMTQTHHIQEYALLDALEKDDLLGLYEVHYMHDVAITNVWLSVVEVDRAQEAYIEEKVYINVEVENLGTSTESFSVKVYVDPNLADPILVETKDVKNLGEEEKRTLTFTWNTADVPVTDYYRIKAEITGANDSFSANNDYTTTGTVRIWVPFDDSPPDIPVLNNPTANGTTVTLTWTPVGGAYGYKVYRNGGTEPIWQGWTIGATYTDTGLSPATEYTYRLTAYDEYQNESDPSEGKSIFTE